MGIPLMEGMVKRTRCLEIRKQIVLRKRLTKNTNSDGDVCTGRFLSSHRRLSNWGLQATGMCGSTSPDEPSNAF